MIEGYLINCIKFNKIMIICNGHPLGMPLHCIKKHVIADA